MRILLIRTQRTPTPTPTQNVPSAKVSGTFICFIRFSGTTDSHDSVRFASFLSSRKNCVKVPSCSMAGVIVCSQYICASRQEVDWNGSLMRFVVSSIAAARVVPVDENTFRNARNANEKRSGVIVFSFSTRRRLSRRSKEEEFVQASAKKERKVTRRECKKMCSYTKIFYTTAPHRLCALLCDIFRVIGRKCRSFLKYVQ